MEQVRPALLCLGPLLLGRPTTPFTDPRALFSQALQFLAHPPQRVTQTQASPSIRSTLTGSRRTLLRRLRMSRFLILGGLSQAGRILSLSHQIQAGHPRLLARSQFQCGARVVVVVAEADLRMVFRVHLISRVVVVVVVSTPLEQFQSLSAKSLRLSLELVELVGLRIILEQMGPRLLYQTGQPLSYLPLVVLVEALPTRVIMAVELAAQEGLTGRL